MENEKNEKLNKNTMVQNCFEKGWSMNIGGKS